MSSSVLGPVPVAEGLDIRQEGPVVRATINRGKDNLMSMEMCRALTALLHAPPEGARILHLKADGTTFCLGRDRDGGSEDTLRQDAVTLVALNRALGAGGLVTVAEVSGDAAGYGVGLAALCDLSFAAPSARFWFPEVEAGLAPTVVLAWLPLMVGRAEAFRLTASALRIDGRRAAELGLVTGVAQRDEDLTSMVEAEIAMLLRQPFEAQLAIRSFLSETTGVAPAARDELSVNRLVANSLRLDGANPAPA